MTLVRSVFGNFVWTIANYFHFTNLLRWFGFKDFPSFASSGLEEKKKGGGYNSSGEGPCPGP